MAPGYKLVEELHLTVVVNVGIDELGGLGGEGRGESEKKNGRPHLRILLVQRRKFTSTTRMTSTGSPLKSPFHRATGGRRRGRR